MILPVDAQGFQRVGYIAANLVEVVGRPSVSGSVPAPALPPAAAPAEPPEPEPQPRSPEPKVGSNPVESKVLVESGSQAGPAAVQAKVPGRFGLGLSLGLSPGGAVPTIIYDLNEQNSVVGMFSFVTGASALSAGLLHRFPQPSKNPDQAVTFEPFLGGGLSLVNVDYGSFFGSESFTGFFGAGGAFLRFKQYPHWRFSGTIYLIQFNLGEFDSPAVRGVGAAIGFAYFF